MPTPTHGPGKRWQGKLAWMRVLRTVGQDERRATRVRRVGALAWLGALALATGACSRQGSVPPPAVLTPMPTATVIDPRAALAPVPEHEPPEEDLQRLTFKLYDDIERAGGLHLTVSATGRTVNLRPRLYAVQKNACTPTPQRPPGWYQCDLTVRLSLRPDGREPSDQGERISVRWDARGMWVLQ